MTNIELLIKFLNWLFNKGIYLCIVHDRKLKSLSQLEIKNEINLFIKEINEPNKNNN